MAERDEPKPAQPDPPATLSPAQGLDLHERKCAVMHIDLPWEPATLHARRSEKLSADIELSVQGAAVSSKRKRSPS